jgi:catechol 2,3-dioxygenase-like lactoylglutathione lyase family enzyme
MFQALRRIQVAVSDFARSRRFYGETLGLPEVGGFEKDWVEFGLGPVLLKLIPMRPGEVPSRNQVAAVLSSDRIEETPTALKERGVTVTRAPQDEFTGRSAEILDPDGYRIVVFQASELHPDEEWVPSSHVDEVVKQRVAQRLQKAMGKPAPKPAPAKAKPAPKPPAKVKGPAPKKPAPKKPAPKKPAPKAAPKKKR